MPEDKRRARLAQMINEVKGEQAKVKAILDANDLKGGEDSPGDMESMKAINKGIGDKMKAIADLQEILAIQSNVNGLDDAGHADGAKPAASRARKSLGQLFSEEPDIASFVKSLGTGSTTNRRIDSPKFNLEASIKTLVTGASGDAAFNNTGTSGGVFVTPDYTGMVDRFYQKPLQVADLITHGQTGSDTVEYVRVSNPTNNAFPTAEAANITDGDTSGKKPESAMTYARVMETVRTIPHWIPATNRALADAGQLRTLIDEFLRYGIQEQLEHQILAGLGTGEEFSGIFHTANVQDQEFSTDILATTRKARTLIQVNAHTFATAYVLNPFDWESIDLTKDSQGRYYFGGPTVMGQKTLWGLPVVESELIEQGVGIVADWKKAVLWDRQESQISVSNSHNDFFVRNLVAILAEMRAAFGIVRPQAFCRMDLTSSITS